MKSGSDQNNQTTLPDSRTFAQLVQESEIEVVGRIEWSSNAIFLMRLDDNVHAVYKPERGERPLGDFPAGIWQREVAAFALSEALGWNCVPATVAIDGPFGPGSLQRFVDADFSQHYFTMIADADHAMREQLKRICSFDLIANNTDRKAGHCLVDNDQHVWAIDNALCFHRDEKLRTVLWDFAGETVNLGLRDDVRRLAHDGLPKSLSAQLSSDEQEALMVRMDAFVHAATFPHDATGYRHPWPLI